MFFRFSSKIEFNKELAKYLYKELKNEKLKVKKENILLKIIINDNEYLLIDCLAGKVFHNKNNEERYLCSLSNFKNKTHLGEAYNCAVFNVEKIKEKIKSLKNDELIKESQIEVLDLRIPEILDLRTKKNKFIILINNIIYEKKYKIEAFKSFFKKFFKIEDIKFILKNYTNEEYINTYGEAYKNEDNKEIIINYQSLKNITFNDFYYLLQKEYPNFNIKNNNRILQRICGKYSEEEYEWVKERAEYLINKEDMNEDMAYGIAWMQLKEQIKNSKII